MVKRSIEDHAQQLKMEFVANLDFILQKYGTQL